MKIGKEIDNPDNPALKPARRIWVATLFGLLCICIAISYSYLQTNFHHADQTACQRANDVRKESNVRIYAHVQDEQNLLDFLSAITHTRTVEAEAWSNLNTLIKASVKTNKSLRESPVYLKEEKIIINLINTYKDARNVDANIRKREVKIHFDKLNIVNCSKAT